MKQVGDLNPMPHGFDKFLKRLSVLFAKYVTINLDLLQGFFFTQLYKLNFIIGRNYLKKNFMDFNCNFASI
jgi:hypothetical protein